MRAWTPDEIDDGAEVLNDLNEGDAERPRYRPNGRDPELRTPEPLVLVNPSTLKGVPVPDRRWMVRDWIPMDRVTALYGTGGEGKTLLAQMLATACAIGGQWLGLPVHKCRSLLLFCEDDQEEMHRRQKEINAHFGCSWDDLNPMLWLPRLAYDNALMTFDGRPLHTKLFDQVLAAAKDHEAELIVTDTLADVFAGNENDRGQARAFAQSALGLIGRETRGAVLTLAHPSRAGVNSGSGESGSTGWIATFRSQLYLSTPQASEGEPVDKDVRILTRKKANAARRDEAIELRWRNGVFVPTRQTGVLASIERRTCERVFLDLLARVIEEGRHVSESSHAPNFAPKLFSVRPDREGYTKADFNRAMQSLFAGNAITMGTYKRSRHSYDCIVPTGARGARGYA